MLFSQVLSCIAAAVSLALGLYFDFGVKATPVAFPSTRLLECSEPKVDWVEGVAILIVLIIVVMVGLLNDWQKGRQFRALNDKKRVGPSRSFGQVTNRFSRSRFAFRVELSMEKTD